MSNVTQASTPMLATGIWSALVTTIMGLVISIPTLACCYGLMLKFRSLHLSAVESSRQALTIFRAGKLG